MSFYTQLMGRHFVEPSLQMEYSMISCCYHLVADTGISFPDMNLGMRQLHSPSYWTPSPPPLVAVPWPTSMSFKQQSPAWTQTTNEAHSSPPATKSSRLVLCCYRHQVNPTPFGTGSNMHHVYHLIHNRVSLVHRGTQTLPVIIPSILESSFEDSKLLNSYIVHVCISGQELCGMP